MFETGIVRANQCESEHEVKRDNMANFSIFFNLKICCVSSLESPR